MNSSLSPSTATILVVDDTPANISVLLGLLNKQGYKVLVANDGASALEQLKHVHPDLILLDVMMPGLDGFEVCRRIKQLPDLAEIPILFLTALDETEEKLKGFAAGAADYVTKPLRHPEVLARVNVHLALHRANHALKDANNELERRVDERTRDLTQSNRELSTALDEIELLKSKLQAENAYLREELQTQAPSSEIVGSSPALKVVMAQIAKVAPTSSTVFVLGETGTGKELIARAIHQGSPRKDKTLVKLNCAAISAGLVESELFGHTKGAFTGATDKRIGRFELADGGTLFLDEVSELPLDTQVKLLRVLQEQEFEPVGSSRTVKVDVRVVAASNRDLPAEIAAGRFRADLYHRLNVFPLQIPSLRERRADIAELTAHFMGKAARKLNRTFRGIADESMAALLQYSWPGNIRELQNVIERSAILSSGPDLEVDLSQLSTIQPLPTVAPPAPAQAPHTDPNDVATFAEVQRSHLIAVLQKTRGVIEGTHGAARLLNMKPSTVRYRIRKLGITRDEY